MEPVNKVVLDGRVIKVAETRYSPAGIPKTKLILAHASRQPEGDHLKAIECNVTVQIMGAEHDPLLKTLNLGDWIRIQGFLLRNAYREDQSWLKIQALGLEKLNRTPTESSAQEQTH